MAIQVATSISGIGIGQLAPGSIFWGKTGVASRALIPHLRFGLYPDGSIPMCNFEGPNAFRVQQIRQVHFESVAIPVFQPDYVIEIREPAKTAGHEDVNGTLHITPAGPFIRLFERDNMDDERPNFASLLDWSISADYPDIQTSISSWRLLAKRPGSDVRQVALQFGEW